MLAHIIRAIFFIHCLRLALRNFAWQPANRNDVTSDHAIAGRGPRPARPLQTDSGKRQSVRLAALGAHSPVASPFKLHPPRKTQTEQRIETRAQSVVPLSAGCFCHRNRESKVRATLTLYIVQNNCLNSKLPHRADQVCEVDVFVSVLHSVKKCSA